MKKIIFLLFLAIFLSTSSLSYAVGTENIGLLNQKTATGTTSARQPIKTQVQQTQMTNLQERATTEITRRVNFLNELSGKINAVKKISDADKATLKSQIQQQIDGLTVLQAKINSDTDLTTLKADVKTIIDGYYIFAFFRVKISLLVAADRLSAASLNMDIIYNKLQTRVAELKAKGEKVSNEEALLSDMRKKIDDANLQYQAALEMLNELDAQGYPKNKTSLTQARSKIKLGATALRNSFKNATQIRQMFVSLGEKEKLKVASGSALKDN